jgi:UDP-glucuronate decarboxylase
MAEVIFEKRNILVTGGAGFIGSHLCERLVRDGHRVICLDNFSTGNAGNIDALLPNPNFQFLRIDVNQPFDLEKFTELSGFKLPFQGIQEIYHLACPTSIKQFEQFKIQTLLSNSIGMYNVLEIARRYRSKILLGSSSVVYGPRKPDHPYVAEEDLGALDHLSPRACYDEGRKFAETMLETYKQVHGLDTKIARIFRTYGPRMPLFDGQLVPDFVLNALDGKDVIIYGTEEFRSSLVYVADVVDALVRIMGSTPGLGPVNVGSDQDLKMTDVAGKIIAMTESHSKIVFDKPLLFISELPLPRIDRAKELGWFPLTRLEDGLERTIEYIKANKLLISNV